MWLSSKRLVRLRLKTSFTVFLHFIVYFQQDPLLTAERGILWDVPSLGHDYWAWIHQPYEGTLRLFDSSLLESMTRTAWYVVPLVWLPIVAFFGFSSVRTLCADYGETFSFGMVDRRVMELFV